MRVNLILVYNCCKTEVLCCLRNKEPFTGKYNFVGGKVEVDEDSFSAAYRELEEETGITKADIKLQRVIDYNFYEEDGTCYMEVFAGRLLNDVELVEEEQQLKWISLNENFFDCDKFAGHGNLGFVLNYVKAYMNI